MSKVLSLALAGVMVAGCLDGTAALAQSAAPAVDKPVTITFYDYNLASAGNGADATKKLIAEFEAANPNIKVNGVGVGSADFSARIPADIAAQRPIDLIQLAFSDLDYAVHNYGAKALEDVVPADEIKAHLEGMAPKGVKLGVLDGKTYALPFTFSTPVLFYNADLFKAAGLDPDQPPKTWAEVKTDAVAIQQKTGKTGFISGIYGPTAGDWLFQGVVRSNGGAVISPDRKTMSFASPEGIEAVKVLRDIHDAGAMPEMLDINAQMEAMASGNAGMYLQTSAIQAFLIKGATGKFDLRASTMPAFGDKPVRPNNSGSALVIVANDPVKQRAAWELEKFLTSKHGYTIITSQIGYLPLRTDIVDDPAYLGDWVKAHPLVQPNLKQLAVLEPWDPMPGPNYRQIAKLMMDAAESATFSNVDVAETLKTAQDQAQALFPN